MESDSRYDFRARFAEQVCLGEAEVNLQRAALYLAGEEYADLDVPLYLGRMDDMAGEARAMAGNSAES